MVVRALDNAVLRVDDIDAAFGSRWDAMPARRGTHADIYDSFAWHASWWRASPQASRQVRVVAAFSGDEPVALLPLAGDPVRGWRTAGASMRPRSRLVLGDEHPDPDAVGAIVEALGRHGFRALGLHRLPSRDPATTGLLKALREGGYRVAARPQSADNVAFVEGDWSKHAARFKGFATSARRAANRIAVSWPLAMTTYGTTPDRPMQRGFEIYADVQARSWKGGLGSPVRAMRAELLARAAALDRARIYVLSVADVPIAVDVWFRLGGVAIGYSTAYDKTVAALSPGTITAWWAQEHIFDDPTHPIPAVVDLLPGASGEKTRIAPETTPLLEVDAVRGRVVSGVELPLRQHLPRVGPAVRARLRTHGSRTQQATNGPEPTTVRLGSVGSAATYRQLDVDAVTCRFLATAAGATSAKAVAAAWADDDAWWEVGTGPAALVRVRAGQSVREVVAIDPQYCLDNLRSDLDIGPGSPDHAGDLVPWRRPLLPWPSKA